MVEFALILPLFMVLVFGIFDLGRAFNYWIDETHLSTTGARWAVVNANLGQPTLQQYIKNQVETKELKNGSASVTTAATVCIGFPTNPATASFRNPGDPVVVRVYIRYRLLSFFGAIPGGDAFNPNFALVAKSTMRLEQAPDATYIPAGSGGTGTCPAAWATS